MVESCIDHILRNDLSIWQGLGKVLETNLLGSTSNENWIVEHTLPPLLLKVGFISL
jgi:hypothetical protein